MIGIRITRATCKHRCRLDHRCQRTFIYDKKQHISKRRKIKLNEKIKLCKQANKRKDKKRVVLTSLVCWDPRCQMLLTMNKGIQKSNQKWMWTQSKRKLKGSLQFKNCVTKRVIRGSILDKCFLSTNLTSKYYKLESVGAQGKLCTGGFA